MADSLYSVFWDLERAVRRRDEILKELDEVESRIDTLNDTGAACLEGRDREGDFFAGPHETLWRFHGEEGFQLVKVNRPHDFVTAETAPDPEPTPELAEAS